MATVPNVSSGDTSNPATQIFKYVGSDLVSSNITNSTTETTIGSVTVNANDVSTGIFVIANVRFTAGDTTGTANSTINLKIGASGSEATKQTIVLKGCYTTNVDAGDAGMVMYWDTSQTWTNAISVIITGKNSRAVSGCTTYCDSLVVFGV